MNRKQIALACHPSCSEQFRSIAKLHQHCLAEGVPIVSVDSKKELIGRFKHPGAKLSHEGEQVLDNDFPSNPKGRVVAYGISDLRTGHGFFVVDAIGT